jgi:type I restriction enzyme R subunit
LETVFAKKKHVEYSDLFEPPFTNFGINAPIPMFEERDLREMIGLCKGIESQVFGYQQAHM